MKAIMVMFDTLNRRLLEPYGCDWTKTPNFSRLANQSVTFERSYVASMPCMPARREIHTGRYNFLHRSWGPLEPFDDSMPEILKKNGIYTHIVSDHYHYWEDGGATYHNRYSSWDVSRGQEGDYWKGELKDPEIPECHPHPRSPAWRQDWVNRKYMKCEEDMPQARTFKMGEEFIRTNADADNWFLTIETFDPHEPFFTQERWKKLYPHDYNGPHFDWPRGTKATEDDEVIQHVRMEYAALLSMCDHYMGQILCLMDELDLWKDTMLIVNTDHGWLLAEHEWWGKCIMPFYNEVANTPLFIWDPRSGKKGERRDSLVQTIDLAPTLLEYFGIERPKDMQGVPLKETISTDEPVREAGLFGNHGAWVNVTDGRYVYMRAPATSENVPQYNYTLMPTHMIGFFRPHELETLELSEPFSFTKGYRVMKTATKPWIECYEQGNMLFDLEADPNQENPLNDPEAEKRMIRLMVDLMKANDCPAEQYERMGLQQ